MKKLTPKDLSQADFDAWKDAPWFVDYLSQKVKDSDDDARDAAQGILVADAQQLDTMRMSAAARAGRLSGFIELQDLTYEDIVDTSLVEVANG